MSTSSLDDLLSSRLLAIDKHGQCIEYVLELNTQLEHPLQRIDSSEGQGKYTGMDWNGQPFRELMEIASSFNKEAAEGIGYILKSVGWQVEILSNGRLIIAGFPPSIPLIMNQRIYPLFCDPEEQFTLLMDEAVMSCLAEFHAVGKVVVKGEVLHKQEPYHQFELLWEFGIGGEREFVRKFRLGYPVEIFSRWNIRWEEWKVARDPRFGYFTLLPNHLFFNEPHQDAIASHRIDEPWETFRTRIGW
jgi:hypothetical protein